MQKILFVLLFIPRVIFNLVKIAYEETANLAKRLGWIKSLAILAVILVLAGFGGWKYYQQKKKYAGLPDDYFMTLDQAAKIGEKTTHKLMVQIENPKGNPADLKGRYQRGDIVMAAPGERDFSDAEKTGFLIIRMELTDKQAELLMRPQEEVTGEKREGGEPVINQLKRRKFTVDLPKIGIAPDDEKGRVVDDPIYKWDIVVEKEIEE